MTIPVVFDFANFIAQYPQFANISEPMAAGFFQQATILCANNIRNPAITCDDGTLDTLLGLLTAHIAWLQSPKDALGNPAATSGLSTGGSLVGHIDQANEGSVSVHADMGDVTAGSPSQAFYMQTQWGTTYWYMTAGVRTARPVSLPTIVAQPPFWGRGLGRFGRGCGVY